MKLFSLPLSAPNLQCVCAVVDEKQTQIFVWISSFFFAFFIFLGFSLSRAV